MSSDNKGVLWIKLLLSFAMSCLRGGETASYQRVTDIVGFTMRNSGTRQASRQGARSPKHRSFHFGRLYYHSGEWRRLDVWAWTAALLSFRLIEE